MHGLDGGQSSLKGRNHFNKKVWAQNLTWINNTVLECRSVGPSHLKWTALGLTGHFELSHGNTNSFGMHCFHWHNVVIINSSGINVQGTEILMSAPPTSPPQVRHLQRYQLLKQSSAADNLHPVYICFYLCVIMMRLCSVGVLVYSARKKCKIPFFLFAWPFLSPVKHKKTTFLCFMDC